MSEAAVHALERKNRYLAPPWHTFVLIGSLLLPVLLHIHIALGNTSSQVAPDLLRVYLRTIALEWALFGFVWYGVRKNGFSLRVLLGPRWKDTDAIVRDVVIGVGFAIVAFGCSKLIAALLRNSGGGASTALPHTLLQRAVWVVLAVTAGIVEETVYRGYLQTQFHRMGLPVPVALAAQAALFAAVHLYQGWNHAVSIAAFGVIAGLIAEWRHSIRPTMIGHSLIDIAASVIPA